LSGQSQNGIVLIDSEGQNFGDVSVDLRVQRVTALLSNTAHIHCCKDAVFEADRQKIMAMSELLYENRLTLSNDRESWPMLFLVIRSNRQGLAQPAQVEAYFRSVLDMPLLL